MNEDGDDRVPTIGKLVANIAAIDDRAVSRVIPVNEFEKAVFAASPDYTQLELR
ncbi:hypothetical protein HYG81_25275 (plasmid) [Natrinema zhouii]|uniref:hypothetical protein n=1 Tax=Natrinema zhouii TaxID=1710539 RepID=UPI001CFFE940|nr:hypothetical protein [Natrinema zhouii]UHQ99058.1 hypothetical protein HYG81_25275 [Natrinema zhouii]